MLFVILYVYIFGVLVAYILGRVDGWISGEVNCNGWFLCYSVFSWISVLTISFDIAMVLLCKVFNICKEGVLGV